MHSRDNIKQTFPLAGFVISSPKAQTPILILFSVIAGIPFYRSSGQNSGYKGTWLPFLGIKESTGWLIKPQLDVPSHVTEFCKSNNVHEKIALKRLGNIQTWCISACIGGGFWETPLGDQLREYLQKSYPNLFLHKYGLNHFSAVISKEIIPIKGWKRVNYALKSMGALMPLNSLNSRLPTQDEIKFFNMTNNTVEINQALTMLLVQDNELNQSAYEAILFLSQYDSLFHYAMETCLFESAAQLADLQRIIRVKGDAIQQSELAEINQLSSFFKLNWKRELIHDAIFRQALRILAMRDNNIQIKYAKVVYNLYKINLLDYAMKLLSSTLACDALRALSAIHQLDKENIILVSLLNEKKLLTKPLINMLLDEDVCELLKKLYNSQSVNQVNIDLIMYLHGHEMLEKFVKFIKNNTTRSMLAVLYKQNALTKNNIKLMRVLHANDLIDHKVEILFEDEMGRLALQVLNKVEALNNENIHLIAVLKQFQVLDMAVNLLAYEQERNFLFKLCGADKGDMHLMKSEIAARISAYSLHSLNKSTPSSRLTMFDSKQQGDSKEPGKNNNKPGLT